jgi:uncharacterized protein YcbX
MSNATDTQLGRIASLWRYPVKSMMGEELAATEVTDRGLLGDRAYALVDRADGKVATAKNPRKWPQLFDYRATYAAAPCPDVEMPSVQITLPDGTILTSSQHDRDDILSRTLNREVTLETSKRRQQEEAESVSEEYWPDMEGLDYRDAVTDFELPAGTFFDIGVVHLLTTATLDRLRELNPQGRFEVRRFRPNIVVETSNGATGFVENGWIGQTLAIGERVSLHITEPCPRCVMTTLLQGDLPKDVSILHTAVQHNQAHVGVYATVLRGGRMHRGDAIRIA